MVLHLHFARFDAKSMSWRYDMALMVTVGGAC